MQHISLRVHLEVKEYKIQNQRIRSLTGKRPYKKRELGSLSPPTRASLGLTTLGQLLPMCSEISISGYRSYGISLSAMGHKCSHSQATLTLEI
ncbi:hypothetical protein P5673_012468 [Acropora cervicornis]|uniref:Uncharacterized protein n=1 Tax=Acropora cervicornis TaxID=6130 RepID=A0AAD9QMZ0_ACRCE|nr:hypothetical protein P5673_012468 [Acropora cervicornis]